MDLPSLCLFMTATLSVHPDRSQFFQFESVNMSCAHPGNFSSWILKRNTSSETSVSCEVGWGRRNGSTYINRSIYERDSGVYWCESETGECSNALNITVNKGVVILGSPTLPVAEGEKVMLRCFYRKGAQRLLSDFNATFYRDDVFVGSHPEGKMILSPVSKADEGSYRCQHPTAGESPQSLLVVTVGAGPTLSTPSALMSLPRLLCTVLLFVLYTVITILCIHLYRQRARAGADAKR